MNAWGAPAFAGETKNILVLGDSLSAGYGLSPEKAYPVLLQKKIDDSSLPFKVINGGVSGETSAGGVRRIDWLLKNRVDVLILELGANDGLRGVPLESTRENLQTIIDRTHEVYPEAHIVIAGMMVPPNLGIEYSREFKNIFSDLARRNEASLIPFLLEGVAGRPELNLADGIHPTAAGHRRIAETVWSVLKPVLLNRAGS